jgi:hypothetical protein
MMVTAWHGGTTWRQGMNTTTLRAMALSDILARTKVVIRVVVVRDVFPS